MSPDPKAASAYPADPQSWNRYSYAGNNPLAFIDPDGKEKLKVVVTTYIPEKTVRDPLFHGIYNGNAPAMGRGENSLNYKTRQFVLIETDKNVSQNPLVDKGGRAGTTVKYDSDGTVQATGQAPSSTLQEGATRNSDGSVAVSFTGDPSDPLFKPASPSIDFNLNVSCSGGSCTMGDSQHDGYPAFRVEVTNEAGQTTEIYNYDPRPAGKGPAALFPPMDCKVPSGGSVERAKRMDLKNDLEP